MTEPWFETDPGARRDAPHALRNREPILAVLSEWLPERGVVLEIGSGTGQHVTWFAERLPGLVWQPSDPDPGMRASIAAWSAEGGAANLRPPLAIATTDADWGVDEPDLVAVLSMNMIHIAPWAAGQGLITGAGRLLPAGGLLYLYGPFKRGGAHTAPSNAEFDAMLRGRDPAWGIRDLEEVTALAEAHGLGLETVIEMPANNLSVIYRRATPQAK
jgi:SAM-dependent methyltransferase